MQRSIPKLSPFRGTNVLLHGNCGLMKRTSPLLVPPFLIRLVVSAGTVLVQSFISAHVSESQRLHTENQVQNACPPLTSDEALVLLNMQPGLMVPLTRPEDREMARKNFEVAFEKAKQCENHFLQGKFSHAFRLCVDEGWDR